MKKANLSVVGKLAFLRFALLATSHFHAISLSCYSQERV